MMRRAAWLLLLPFLILSTLSQGTMLDADDGGVRIVLCTDAGPAQAVLNRDGTVRPEGEGPTGDHAGAGHCVWSTHAQAALADVGPPVIQAAQVQRAAAYARAAPRRAPRAGERARSARDPPQA